MTEREFTKLLDDIVELVTDNCTSESEKYVDDYGKKRADENIVATPECEPRLEKLLRRYICPKPKPIL